MTREQVLEQESYEDAVSREAVLGLFAQNADAVRPYSKTWEEVKALPSVQPKPAECEDCISREDALMALTGEWTDSTDELIHRFIRRIKKLPPVNPHHTEAEIQKMQELEQAEIQRAYELGKAEWPKTGHWIRHVEDWEWWECSECHSTRAYGNEYCPDCGSHNGDVRKWRDKE